MINIRDNIIYEGFDNKTDLHMKIINMIGKLHNVYYKGNPDEINYKIMKRTMVKYQSVKIDPDDLRKMYEDTIKPEKREFCIIYKESTSDHSTRKSYYERNKETILEKQKKYRKNKIRND